MPKLVNAKPKDKTYRIRLEKELYDKVDYLCTQTKRTYSNYVREAIERALLIDLSNHQDNLKRGSTRSKAWSDYRRTIEREKVTK